MARRAAERLQALQREADRLASDERTLLGDLRKLEVERQIKAEELKRVDADALRVTGRARQDERPDGHAPGLGPGPAPRASPASRRNLQARPGAIPAAARCRRRTFAVWDRPRARWRRWPSWIAIASRPTPRPSPSSTASAGRFRRDARNSPRSAPRRKKHRSPPLAPPRPRPTSSATSTAAAT